jgi:hypothetical protein
VLLFFDATRINSFFSAKAVDSQLPSTIPRAYVATSVTSQALADIAAAKEQKHKQKEETATVSKIRESTPENDEISKSSDIENTAFGNAIALAQQHIETTGLPPLLYLPGLNIFGDEEETKTACTELSTSNVNRDAESAAFSNGSFPTEVSYGKLYSASQYERQLQQQYLNGVEDSCDLILELATNPESGIPILYRKRKSGWLAGILLYSFGTLSVVGAVGAAVYLSAMEKNEREKLLQELYVKFNNEISKFDHKYYIKSFSTYFSRSFF